MKNKKIKKMLKRLERKVSLMNSLQFNQFEFTKSLMEDLLGEKAVGNGLPEDNK